MADSNHSMSESKRGQSGRARWPRDLKVFALLAALWAAALTARIVVRDVTYYSQTPLEAIFFGMRFDGNFARFVLIAQAMAASTVAIGLAAERRWGLVLAFLYLLEAVASNLIFMTSYIDDLAEGSNVRLSGLAGIVAVLVLLYLWIRAHDLLLDDDARV
jgi:hypothetical protein